MGVRQEESAACNGDAEHDGRYCDFHFHGCFSRVGFPLNGNIVAPGDRPGTVFGVPVMLGIPVMGSVDAATAVVFAAGSATAGAVGIIGAMVPSVGVT